MDNFFIKKGYKNNPVEKYDSNQKYWTKKRIKSSNFFQYGVYAEVKKYIDYSKKSKLIDIGCGTGLKLNMLQDSEKNLEIFGVDTLESVEVCKKELNFGNFLVDDLSNYNKSIYEEHKHSFDYIVCSDVIEHLDNPDKLLEIIKYLSHDESIIVISTPERIKFRGHKNNQPTNSAHVREWSANELKLYLKSKRFKIINHKFMLPVKVAFNKIFFDEIIRRVFSFKNVFYNQVILLKYIK